MSTEIAHRISGIILAAGESRRMGTPKALCNWRETTFLEAVTGYLREAGITQITVVLGTVASQIQKYGIPDGIQVAVNPYPQNGQLSSLQTGLSVQKSRFLGTIVALVDHPAVSPDTIGALIEAFANRPELLIKPRFQERGGHPILIGRLWWQEILSAPTKPDVTDGQVLTLRDILIRHPDQIRTIDVDDSGILIDIDTPEILSKLSHS